MPRLRRRNKARASDLSAWAELFAFQFDYFGSAAAAGINVDEYGRPDEAERQVAWHRLGAAFLEQWTDRQVPPWALTAFGPPAATGRRRR